jgi:hypothetical protein
VAKCVFPRPGLPQKYDRLLARQVSTFAQIPNQRRRNVRRDLEVELLQRLHRRQVCFLNPPRDRLAFAFLYFPFQQRFQITQVRLLLFHGFSGQTRELSSQCWQPQLFGVLLDGRLLHRPRRGAHWITSVTGQFGRNRS